MRQTLRISAVCALLALTAVSTFAQSRPLVGTVVDIDEGRGRLVLEYDEDQSRIEIEMDSVSTVYDGFGTMIAGKPEIFTGSAGLANVREGDRVSVRAYERGTGSGIYKAERVTLIGRPIAASQVGVGQTREPTSATTPTAPDPRTTRDQGPLTEGTIRQINLNDGRIVIQTPQRRMLTVRASRNTPVLYRGETYRIANLEIGDRIRVEADPTYDRTDELTARRIIVTQSVQDTGTEQPGGRVTTISGRVARVEPGLDYLYVDDDGRAEIRVDMSQAKDAAGDAIRARDLRVGEQVEISGSFNRVGDMFQASTVRFQDADREDEPPRYDDDFDRPGLITTGGTVMETLEDASTVGVRETDTNRIVRIFVIDDFVVRTKGNTYVTAETLRVNDRVIIQAYRDARGNLIAQTIRLQNR